MQPQPKKPRKRSRNQRNGKEEEHPENVELLGPKVLYRPQKEKDTKTLQIEVCI